METVNLEILGKDPKVQKAIQMAKNFGVAKVPVLITGEIGVGKKALARYIHQQSGRAVNAFCVVDCSQDPALVEKAIFGHRDENSNKFHRGAFEEGNKGTVVFTNIDCLPFRIHGIMGFYVFWVLIFVIIGFIG